MKKLQTLYKVRAGTWIADLVELKNLKKLGIGDLDEATMGLLTIAIAGGGLDKLRSLYLCYGKENGFSSNLLEALYEEYREEVYGFSLDLLEALSTNRHLQKLNLIGKIKKLPSKFPSNLIKLTLEEACFFEDPMLTLEKLQHLLFLKIYRVSYQGYKMVCSANGFPKLERLKISFISKLVELTVEEGAMSCLMTCKIHNCRWLKMVPQGFKFLTMLQKLKITMMPQSFEQRVKEGGEDWETIKHIQFITVRVRITCIYKFEDGSSRVQVSHYASRIEDEMNEKIFANYPSE
ncbi:Disease resistance protein rpp8 [Thalictrum thalictroides]|uniref:Disease resistance protein rpp8 n=1 Tax=Thalictrum thalictroides TaxID=46969 RepID=A0A7J6W2V4_THATH|nr:Disease resistance protein rpp8 [Thalictrum thalictroides]